MTELVGRVAELWRYPVKSMGGARVETVRLDRRGVHADRLWAVRDLADRRTSSARRLPVLLRCTARYAEEPGADAGPGRPVPVVVTLPDGEELTGDDPRIHGRLSELCGREVRLVPLPPSDDKGAFRGGLVSGRAIRRELGLADHEPLPDASAMPLRALATVARYSTPPGSYADLAPVHLLSRTAIATLGRAAQADDEQADDEQAGLDVRRFRPSVLVDLLEEHTAGDAPFPERGWVGGEVRIGSDARLPVTMPTVRCVVPTREQPGLAARRELSRALSETTDRFLGVYADVSRPGAVSVGDEVWLSRPEHGRVREAAAGIRRVVLRAGGRVLG